VARHQRPGDLQLIVFMVLPKAWCIVACNLQLQYLCLPIRCLDRFIKHWGCCYMASAEHLRYCLVIKPAIAPYNPLYIWSVPSPGTSRE
jgi:hypothetical protein